jgi:hypothetical protein
MPLAEVSPSGVIRGEWMARVEVVIYVYVAGVLGAATNACELCS